MGELIEGEVMFRDIGKLLAASTIIVLASTSYSYAYLDPGTASIVVQSIVAAVAASAATAGIYWQRLKSLFVGDRGNRKLDKGDK